MTPTRRGVLAGGLFAAAVPLSKFGVAGTKDDTDLIQKAVDSGEAVFIPPLPGGEAYNVQQIRLSSESVLVGHGHATRLRSVPRANVPMIVLSKPTDSLIYVANLVLIGDKENQTSDAHRGIHIAGSYDRNEVKGGSSLHFYDVRNQFADLIVTGFKGDALRIEGRGEQILTGVQALHCDGDGLVLDSYDNSISNSSFGGMGGHGVKLTSRAANNRLTNVKSWYSGMRNPESGDNFHSEASYCIFSACESQDGYGHGFNLRNLSHTVLSGCRIESPGDRKNVKPDPINGLILHSVKYSTFSLSVYERDLVPHMSYSLSISGQTDFNNISLVAERATKGLVFGPIGTNHLVLNGKIVEK